MINDKLMRNITYITMQKMMVSRLSFIIYHFYSCCLLVHLLLRMSRRATSCRHSIPTTAMSQSQLI